MSQQPSHQRSRAAEAQLGAHSIPTKVLEKLFVYFSSELRIEGSIVLERYEPMTTRETKPSAANRGTVI